MNRYPAAAHRPIFAVAAVAMAVATMAFAVVVPATTLDDAPADRVVAADRAPQPVRIAPSRIDVTGDAGSVFADRHVAERPAS